MAALAGLRVDNCLVEIDGPETPGCDGSSRAFADAIVRAGFVEQDAPRDVLVIDRPALVRDGDSVISAFPGETGAWSSPISSTMARSRRSSARGFFVDVVPESFLDELATSRTFLLQGEADALRQGGDRLEDDRARPPDLRP